MRTFEFDMKPPVVMKIILLCLTTGASESLQPKGAERDPLTFSCRSTHIPALKDRVEAAKVHIFVHSGI
jgi:hypothetical protein